MRDYSEIKIVRPCVSDTITVFPHVPVSKYATAKERFQAYYLAAKAVSAVQAVIHLNQVYSHKPGLFPFMDEQDTYLYQGKLAGPFFNRRGIVDALAIDVSQPSRTIIDICREKSNYWEPAYVFSDGFVLESSHPDVEVILDLKTGSFVHSS